MKLNLGCGTDYKFGFVNVDFNESVKVDSFFDLNGRLPYESNSVDFVLCKHLLEHLVDPAMFLQEVERVLKPGAEALIVLPHWNFFGHKRDLTHKRFCTSETFSNLCQSVSYQTNFIVKDIYWCGKWKTILNRIPLSFLEKIGWSIYELRFTLQKKEIK